MGSHSPERTAVSNAYSGKEWQAKVQKMSDSQIIAIYARLKGKGKIK